MKAEEATEHLHEPSSFKDSLRMVSIILCGKQLREVGLGIVDDKQYRERVYEIVRHIPRGRVMTYGQIAGILGEGYTARTVGYVMHGSDDDVPWQRVINSQGKCSTGRLTIPMNLQQEVLESEGIEFNSSGKCDLKALIWYPNGFAPDDDVQPSLLS